MNRVNYKNIQFEDLGKYQIYLDDWEKTSHYELVSQLNEKESQAWSFIRLYSIRFFVFKANSKLLHLVHDLHLGNDEEGEILSRLYKKMIVDKKISSINNTSSSPLFNYIKNHLIKSDYFVFLTNREDKNPDIAQTLNQSKKKLNKKKALN